MAQKIVQYQAVLQLAQQSPQIYNMPLLHRQMLDVLGIKDAQKLVPMAEDMKPLDPITENQNILAMKPVKAFINQDHQAHIQVHMAAIQQMLQNSPAAPQIAAAAQAHIAEHLGFEYRKQIEQQLGFALPPQKDESGEDIHMDPEVEAKLSPLLAQAAQQLLQSNQAEMAQKQAQQQAQDPLVQMQMQELQLKAAEQQRKAQKDQADIQLKSQQIQVERERIAAQERTAAQTNKVNSLKSAAELTAKRDGDATRLKIDGLKTAAQVTEQKRSSNQKMAIDALKTAATLEAQTKNKPAKGE
jgi:hypothetical protein